MNLDHIFHISSLRSQLSKMKSHFLFKCNVVWLKSRLWVYFWKSWTLKSWISLGLCYCNKMLSTPYIVHTIWKKSYFDRTAMISYRMLCNTSSECGTTPSCSSIKNEFPFNFSLNTHIIFDSAHFWLFFCKTPTKLRHTHTCSLGHIWRSFVT